MGWSSYAEDIEELRLHRAAIEERIEKIQVLVSGVKISNPARVEIELDKFLRRISDALAETMQRVSKVFDDAEKKLHDPNVQIVKQLDKKESKATELRQKLASCQNELSACRRNSIGREKTLLALERENAELKKALASQAVRGEFLTAMQGVSPLLTKK